MAARRQRRIDKALAEFRLWVDTVLSTTVANCLVLKDTARRDMKNSVLLFVFPRAVNGVVERCILEVEYAWVLTDRELRRHGLRGLGSSNKHYRHLKRIRNKLVAHKVENALKTDRYSTWYKKTYGSYEAIFSLIQKVAGRVIEKIDLLEDRDLLTVGSISIQGVAAFSSSEMEDLYAALKAKGIY